MTGFVWPAGGVRLRVRAPGFVQGGRISSVSVGGKPWSDFDPAKEVIVFNSRVSGIQDIVVNMSAIDS